MEEELKELAKRLQDKFPWIPTGLEIVVAREVKRIELQARIEEISEWTAVDHALCEIKAAEYVKQLELLKEGK